MQAAMDAEVLKKALDERRILITSDKDFGEILGVLGMARPSVIIFREAELNPTEQLSRLVQILSEVSVELERGAVVVIRKRRFRVRSLPIRGDQSCPYKGTHKARHGRATGADLVRKQTFKLIESSGLVVVSTLSR